MDQFTAVAHDCNGAEGRQDKTGLFFMHVARQGHYGGDTFLSPLTQGMYSCTAAGDLLASTHTHDPEEFIQFLRTSLDAWSPKKTSPTTAAPIPKSNVAEKKTSYQAYLADGLVLKMYVRDLPRQDPDQDATRAYFDQPWYTKDDMFNIDFVWLTKEEMAALLPANIDIGQPYDFPANLVQRLARFHLLDTALGESHPWKSADVKEAKCELIVDNRTDTTTYLTFAGVVRNEAEPSQLFEPMSGNKLSIGRSISLDIYGKAEYDHQQRLFIKFELLAVGIRSGATNYNHRFEDIDSAPIGFAFELAADTRVDRIPPRWIGAEYFGAETIPVQISAS